MLIGKQIGPYRILSRHTFGSIGNFYKAVHIQQKETYALKFLKKPLQNEEFSERTFLQKLLLATNIDHSNIARLYSLENYDGYHFVPVQFCHGQVLSEIIGSESINFDLILRIAIQATRGLLEAHENGLIHEHLTSEAIILLEGSHVKLLNFVLPFLFKNPDDAEMKSSRNLNQSSIVKKPPLINLSYRAPEQVRGEPVDCKTDLYSLGVILYELCVGEFLFLGENIDSLNQQIQVRELPNLITVKAEFSPGWSRLLRGLLQKNPADRYPSAYELLSDLEKLNYGFSLDRLGFRPINPKINRRGFFQRFTGEQDE